LDRSTARARYWHQQKAAKQRGIEWALSFEQWLEWWGEDLDNRGQHSFNLQMCRIGDKGGYELGNIYKGTPAQNMRVAGALRRHRNSLAARARIEAALDAQEPIAADYEEQTEDEAELAHLGVKTLFESRY
jgi:hypothetical protein